PTAGCSGTLLTNDWLITAAHCALDTATPSNNFVTMGSQQSAGVYAVNHPSLDFALIKLATPFTMNGSPYGYRMPIYWCTTASLNGQTLWCRGYGCDSDESESCSGFGTLREAMLSVKSGAYDDYNFTVLANAYGQALAPGDSGGGCLAWTSQGWALAGIDK